MTSLKWGKLARVNNLHKVQQAKAFDAAFISRQTPMICFRFASEMLSPLVELACLFAIKIAHDVVVVVVSTFPANRRYLEAEDVQFNVAKHHHR